jgi:hypothetical protein
MFSLARLGTKTNGQFDVELQQKDLSFTLNQMHWALNSDKNLQIVQNSSMGG